MARPVYRALFRLVRCQGMDPESADDLGCGEG
jgi:hypothetical protein